MALTKVGALQKTGLGGKAPFNNMVRLQESFKALRHTKSMPVLTDDDRERVRLLNIVAQSRDGLKRLSLDDLVKLQELIERKDYSQTKKSTKSKAALLKKINVRIYELTEGRGVWDV